MGLGSMMAGGNPDEARGRAEDDFYPTPPDVTKALIPYLDPTAWWENILEPCAGDGAMVDELLKVPGVKDVYAYDINPQRDDIMKMNFFSMTEMPNGTTCIVTNPPFNIAEKFIRHAFKIGATNLALVLKSTYWHSARRQKLFAEHRPSLILPLTWRPDFKNLGRPTMECQWVVWDTPCSDEYPVYVPLARPT